MCVVCVCLWIQLGSAGCSSLLSPGSFPNLPVALEHICVFRTSMMGELTVLSQGI